MPEAEDIGPWSRRLRSQVARLPWANSPPFGARVAGAELALLALLLLVPTPHVGGFDGLPLAGWPKFAAFCLLLPFAVSPALRAAHRSVTVLRGWSWHAVVAAAAVIAVVARLALLGLGAHGGFTACYRSTVFAPLAGQCELSFDNAFRLAGVTRFDQKLQFAGQAWDLGFFNDDRFDYRPLLVGMPERGHLPFTAHWEGDIEAPTDEEMRIVYVGEGAVHLDGRVTQFPQRTGLELGEVHVMVPSGHHHVAVDYRFDDNFGTGVLSYGVRYAQLNVEVRPRGTGLGAYQPLAAVLPPGLAALGLFGDLVVLALLAGAVAAYVTLLRRWLIAVAVLAVSGPVTFLYSHDPLARQWLEGVLPRFRSLTFDEADRLLFVVPVLGLVAVSMLWRHRHAALGAWLAAVAVAPWAALAVTGPDSGSVLIRSYGDDHLRYESFARQVLATWQPLAGEYVFQYAPLYRYVKFAEHLLFGDGDVVYAAFALAILFFMPAWLAVRLRPLSGTWLPFLSLAAGLVLAVEVTNPMVTSVVFEGLSEYPAWAGLLLAIGLLTPPVSRAGVVIAAVALALAVGIRSNFLFGSALIALLGGLPLLRSHPRWVALAALPALLVILSPLAHNLYYGHEFAPLTTLSNAAGNQAIPPRQLLGIFHDSAVRARLREQFDYLFAIAPISTGWVSADRLLRAIQVLSPLGVVALAVAASRLGRSVPWRARGWALAPLLLPLTFLAVHVIYNVSIYYPRHIVVIYLTAPAAVMWAARRLSTVAAPEVAS